MDTHIILTLDLGRFNSVLCWHARHRLVSIPEVRARPEPTHAPDTHADHASREPSNDFPAASLE
jgi:hypothetical protein